LALRTTFIVGFPGETDEDFAELVEFLETTRFERASVFNYSREEGTRAAKLDSQIHHMTRKKRWNEAMRRLEKLAEDRNREQLGKKLRVLVDVPGQARGEMDAPEVDGTVFVPTDLPVGEFAEVTVREWRGYDLVAN
jgi:ribosomal protein S12 methylthiotransferase